MKRLVPGILTTAVATLAAAPRIANACAMCGLSPGDHEIHAFNTSVIFMLSAPYVITLVIGGALFLAFRIATKKRRAESQAIRKPVVLDASKAF